MLGFGGIQVVGGAGTVGLTTTAAQVGVFSATGGSNTLQSNNQDGNPSVVPDYANNRIKVQPGIYKVTLNLSLDMATGADVEIGIRKNGTAISNLVSRARCTTNKDQVTLVGFFQVTDDDVPGTLPTFADPSSSGFAGAGGAPKTLVPIDATMRCLASTDTATVEYAQFLIERVR
jgi:hypothetical protein